MKLYHNFRRRNQFRCSYETCRFVALTLTLLCCSTVFVVANEFGSGPLENGFKLGSWTNNSSSTTLASSDLISTNKQASSVIRTSSRRDQLNHDHESRASEARSRKVAASKKKHEEVLSTDCLTKRNEILIRQPGTTGQQTQTAPHQATRPNLSGTPKNVGFQRLKPIHYDLGAYQPQQTSTTQSSYEVPIVINAHADSEHVPKCNQAGGYEAIQCHKIGYCWCVNKYGQAIKNTAVRAGERPTCDPSMYESESNAWVVVAGVSTQRVDHLLKNVSSFESTTPNGHLNFEAPEGSTDQYDASSGVDSSADQVGSSQNISPNGEHQVVRSKHRGPIMPLIPNDCKGSRSNARERANRYMNDSIWIPECDEANEQLYAERQCHRSRVCWCVDQTTGLPLRTSEQLTTRTTNSNCTELKKRIELATVPKPELIFYMGSSEHCDADKRADFIISLNDQFKQQISEYTRQNPSSLNNLPQGLTSTNPFSISETQVSKWKFSIMDRDMDGKLGDREWSKFKNNFKLVDRVDELDNPFKQQKSPYFSLTPLLILRSQRKCWRDFLDFCANGDLLIDESISLNKWLSCTVVPPKSESGGSGHHNYHPHNFNRGNAGSSATSTNLENMYANSREAAITRSKHKNPFLQILKPD